MIKDIKRQKKWYALMSWLDNLNLNFYIKGAVICLY